MDTALGKSRWAPWVTVRWYATGATASPLSYRLCVESNCSHPLGDGRGLYNLQIFVFKTHHRAVLQNRFWFNTRLGKWLLLMKTHTHTQQNLLDFVITRILLDMRMMQGNFYFIYSRK